MKKGLLKLLSAVMAISMLLCMSMVAFADGPAYDVVTTYEGTDVKVTTSVTGLTADEQVAFLVEKNNDVIWIDQQTASNGTASSFFTADADLASGAKVKVGTTSLASSTFGPEQTVQLPNYTVTWSIVSENGSRVVAAVADKDDVEGKNDASASTTTGNKVTFYVFPAVGEKLAGVSYGTVTNEELIGNSKEYTITADTAFTFTFAAVEATAVTTPVKGNVVKANEDDAMPTASVAATAENATEFGILVALDSYDWTGFDSIDGLNYETEVRKYDAKAANAEGKFVIELVDRTKVFFVEGRKFKARVYAQGTNLELGELFDLN